MDSSRFVVLCLGIPGSKGKSAPFRFVDLSICVPYTAEPTHTTSKRTKKAPQGKKNGPAGNLQNVHRNNIVF